jgi:hypothetical protein
MNASICTLHGNDLMTSYDYKIGSFISSDCKGFVGANATLLLFLNEVIMIFDNNKVINLKMSGLTS